MTEPSAGEPPIGSAGPGPAPSEEPPIAPPRPRRSRRSLLIGIAAVAIGAILVFSTVLAAGLLTIPIAPALPGSGGLSSGSALARSETTAATISGGPWVPRLEAGFASTSALDGLPSILLDHLPGCSIAPLTPFSVPASLSDVVNGDASAWVVGFTNANASLALLVLVTAQASVGLAFLNGTCVGNLTALPSIQSADAVSAGQIAAHYATNISDFVIGRPLVTAGYFLGGVAAGNLGTLFGWVLVWTTCPTSLTAPSFSATTLTLIANAGTGAVISGPTVQSVVC